VSRTATSFAMGGIRPNSKTRAEVKHIRVHPAMRRRGVGRSLMLGLEDAARRLGFQELHLDTAANQPEAVAFYRGLGYHEDGRETRPDWTWTLVYFVKQLGAQV
jgi:ribosomal protein S18 acetylase RimI-like enzyme